MTPAQASRARRRSRQSGSAIAKPRTNTRQRLLESARRLLERGGYGAASVQAIAERAGVATGALYRHFPSKADLVVEVFRDAATRDLRAMQQAAAAGSFVERLEAAVATFARRALSNRRLARALVYEPVDPPVDVERLIQRRNYCQLLSALLSAGIAAGEVPAQDAELTAAALTGAIAEALLGALSPIKGQRGTSEDVVANLVRFCRQSIGAGSAR